MHYNSDVAKIKLCKISKIKLVQGMPNKLSNKCKTRKKNDILITGITTTVNWCFSQNTDDTFTSNSTSLF